MEKSRKKRTRVALIFGGRGAESDVSISGAKNILRHIDKDKYTVYPVFIDKMGCWYAKRKGREIPVHPVCRAGRAGFLEEDRFVGCSVAFPLLHGDYGEDGRIQGHLDCIGMKYVGCGVSAGSLAFDKIYTKIIAERLGIPTVKWTYAKKVDNIRLSIERAETEIGYPMFIKPACLGSSVGACPALSRDELERALYAAEEMADGRVLIEEYAEDKRELECAYLKTRDKEIATFPGEVLVRGFYGYGEKYLGVGRVELSPRAYISERLATVIREYTLKLAHFLGIRHLARFDYFLIGDTVYLNEINTMPGFTEGSLYAAMLRESGTDERELISLLLEDTLGEI